MSTYLILSNNYSLLRVAIDRIAYIASDGSYSTLKLINGEEHTFSFNLSSFEKILEHQLQTKAEIFIRIGRSFIINSNYIYTIHITKQELILSDSSFSEKFTLQISKEALKALKTIIENFIDIRRIEE